MVGGLSSSLEFTQHEDGSPQPGMETFNNLSSDALGSWGCGAVWRNEWL